MSSVFAVTGPRVIVALDFPTASEALAFAARVTPEQCRLKVGFELFTSAGPAVVETLVEKGFDVFLDLKYHDIPNTVAGACTAAAHLGAWMINVHALGGRRMLSAAREALDKSAHRPLLIGVTVLTSHSASDLGEIGLMTEPAAQAALLARLVQESGLDGVVCSALEAPRLRAEHGPGFCLVTPGIRPAGSAHGDQERVVTPADAVRQGAHYLVIGRPITQAAEPLEVLTAINRELVVPS
jgi:orotidine-5'-phosphate decarboxylase